MPDFGLLQMPNFAQAALSGYNAGQQAGQQKRLDAALTGFDFKRPETALPVLRADPATGAALLGAAQKMADADRDHTTRSILSNFMLDRHKAAKGGDPSSGVPQGGAPAVTSPDGDIVVTAPTQQPAAPQPDYEADLIRQDPEAYLKVQDNLGRLDENARKRIADAADAQGTVALAAANMPYEARRAYIDSQTDYLTAHGVSPEDIAAFDPTDANIQAQASQALGVKGILEQQNKDRTYQLNADQFTETKRHNGATEASASGNLAVSQGNLALARQREGHVASGAGGGGKAKSADMPQARAVVGGKTYTKINGKWIAQ